VKRRSFWQFYAAPVGIMVLAYLLPMAASMGGIRAGEPAFLRMRQELRLKVGTAFPIATATRQIQGGRYVRATITVFLWNFGVGAVAMSTLIGGVFFALPPMVAAGRGAMIGLLFDPASFEGARGLVALITGALELPNYIMAGALGMRLGLAWLLPPRRERVREVWEHARWSIPAIGLLLLLAAMWEVGGIVYLMRHP
jgi:uncharacterized membrane protein SpoIIM required for sporulation